MVLKEIQKIKIRAVLIDNLRGMFGVRRCRTRNERIRDLCNVGKGVNED